ncbi:MAG: hypothetical protein WC637_21565, partial [Victivallales bacterium]
KLDFALTTNIEKDSPLTKGVTNFWYPLATWTGAQQHSTTFTADSAWTVFLRAMKTAEVRATNADSGKIGEGPAVNIPQPPLAASRQVGAGRIVVFGVSPEYLFANVAFTTLEDIVLDKGLKRIPSDGYKMILNSLRWLAEPSVASGKLGGAGMDKALLENSFKTKFGKPYNWTGSADAFPQANLPLRGVVGARSSTSSGKGSVADWVAAAKAEGLSWIVFLEEFKSLDKPKLEQLKKDCVAATTAEFAAIPGFVIDDECGFHYFHFGRDIPYPGAQFLSKDGKVFASDDPGLDPKNPKLPGQLAMTTLNYAYTTGGFKLTAGNYLFRESKVPFANFFSNFDAHAVVTAKDGSLLEDDTAEYLKLAEVGQGPTPLAINFVDDPAKLNKASWKTVLMLPKSGASAVGDRLEGRNFVTEYWSQWHFYPDNPTRIYVTEGPEIVHWRFNGPRDYEGNNPDAFVWQNQRWRVNGKVRADSGIKEVVILDGEKPFRRFLPGGKEFEFSFDLSHDRQHNLVMIVTDMKGRRAISGEQWDRDHRLEEFNCADRNNQLSYGMQTTSDGYGVMVGGNQPLATPNKRIDGKEISPAGTFKNDALLGAPAFDGGTGGEPDFFLNCMFRTAVGEAFPPNYSEALRLMLTGDVNIGEGRWTHNAADKVRIANVWHSLWRAEPATDFIGVKRNHFFNINPDSPIAVFLWTIKLTLLKDLEAKALQLGFIRTGEAKAWALRGADGSVRCGTWEANPVSGRRSLNIPFGFGAYAAEFDSPLGGIVVYPMSEGIEANVGLPGRENSNIQFWLAKDRLPRKKGDSVEASFLLVGNPRPTARTPSLPNGTNEIAEKFFSDFGMNASGTPAYKTELKAGKILGQRYILDIDGAEKKCASGVLDGKLISTLPIRVAGLNDRWSAYMLERKGMRTRPVGMFEGKAWAVVKLSGALDFFMGHPVTCDNPELFLQVTRTGDDAWRVEIHNPTDKPVKAKIAANPLFEPLAGKKVDAEIDLAPGSSVTKDF